MNRREEFRVDMLCWMTAMVAAFRAMPEAKRQELLDWEERNLNGSTVCTSDWPGWTQYVGAKPTRSDADRRGDETGFVYLVRAASGEHKIGRTRNLRARLRNFGALTPLDVQLVHSFPADKSARAEALLHRRFVSKRIKGEWFDLRDDDVVAFRQIVSYSRGSFIT